MKKNNIFSKLNISGRLVVLLLSVPILSALAGCQKLLDAAAGQDGASRGQTVKVSVTVPHEPPPAALPLKASGESEKKNSQPPNKPVAPGLLPKEDSSQNPFVQPTGSQSAVAPIVIKPQRTVVTAVDTVLTGKVVAEDMVLKGLVLIKGSLVVAPQATLKIEPGTILRFTPEPGTTALPRLVVQGRLVVAGTAQQPVLLSAAFSEPMPSDWGGVVLVSTEKKNQFDHCRIEAAQAGITAHFSRFSSRGLKISRSETAVALYDSEATIQQADFYRCDTGIKLADSELDLRDSQLHENRLGIQGLHASFTLSGVRAIKQAQEAIVTDQCRFRIAGCLIAENRTGVRLHGGDGQILLSRFLDNRENGAELSDVRVRITNSTFSTNGASGLLLENARGLISGSVLVANKGYNLHNKGAGSFTALLNWWGSTDPKLVNAGILDAAAKGDAAAVVYIPFLRERPAIAP